MIQLQDKTLYGLVYPRLTTITPQLAI